MDAVAYSSIMRALNKACQYYKVLQVGDSMHQKSIAFETASLFEIVSACSM